MADTAAPDPGTTRHLDRFGLVLILTIAAVVLLSTIEIPSSIDTASAAGASLVINSLVGATFILSLRAGGVPDRPVRWATWLVAIGLLVTTAAYVLLLLADVDRPVGSRTPSVLFDLLAVLAPVAVCRRLLQHRRVSTNTLVGAISAYLLIALAFALLFLTTSDSISEPFFGTPEPSTSFMYFSLTTISTAGLGDLAPATTLARLLTGAEAILGQVYLVTFVAMIVALYVNNQRVD